MTIALSPAIAAYLAADKRDGDAVATCFTERGTVKDEGYIHTGREAIRHRRTDASAKYSCVVEPFAITTPDGATVVTSHVTGDFPGSPVDLRYFFQLERDKNSALEIML